MWNDAVKLWLLAALYAVCFLSLFTTSSLGRRGSESLRPQLHRFCKAPRQKLKACLEDDGGGSLCSEWMRLVSKCENAVKRGFKHVNMGGCPYEMKQKALCEIEWCEDEGTSNHCREECAKVRSALDDCVKDNILSFLASASLDSSGMTKVQ